MSTYRYRLDEMNEHVLKQIVKKFTPFSGAAFYYSCRGAKDFVDRVKPLWHLPQSKLMYIEDVKVTAGNQDQFKQRGAMSALLPLGFCRIEKLDVSYCNTNYITRVVLPEVDAIGRVGWLDTSRISHSDVQLLIDVAKPETVELWDTLNDPTSATFEGVKNLYIHVCRKNVESYWRTEKLFQLVRNRKRMSLCLQFLVSPNQLIASFIENWQKGQKTGTLERLTVIAGLNLNQRMTLRRELEDLMKSHNKTEEGYIMERGGDVRLRIDLDIPTIENIRTIKIDFFFSCEFVAQKKVDQLQGANEADLEKMVDKGSKVVAAEADTVVPGQLELSDFFENPQIECLNGCDDTPVRQFLQEPSAVLRSDCDERLILTVPFIQPVKLHSIFVKGVGSKAPKKIRIFSNLPKTLDFDDAMGVEPVQIVELGEAAGKDGEVVNLKFVKFQNVRNVQLFIENNQEEGEVTEVEQIKFYGSPVNATTNMDNFKRVSGKKGEHGY